MKPTTRISIDGDSFILASDCDVGDLMERIESASHGEAGFVTFASRFETLSVLVTQYTRAVVSIEHPAEAAPSSQGSSFRDWSDDFWGEGLS